MKLSEETKKSLILTLLGIEEQNYEKDCPKEIKKQILILQRGWVVVGDVKKIGNYLHSENTSVIRNWGTTKGIGEIALNGPTSNTKLDKCGKLTVHELAVLGIIDCEESKWN